MDTQTFRTSYYILLPQSRHKDGWDYRETCLRIVRDLASQVKIGIPTLKMNPFPARKNKGTYTTSPLIRHWLTWPLTACVTRISIFFRVPEKVVSD